jgi:NADPH-dependent curcumin reductase CurA
VAGAACECFVHHSPPPPSPLQLRVIYFSVDPYLRGRMAPKNPYLGEMGLCEGGGGGAATVSSPFNLSPPAAHSGAWKEGEAASGIALGEVVSSGDAGLKVGDVVSVWDTPWRK